MSSVLLTVLTIWAALAVLAALFVAALGRSGLREEQARERVRARAQPGAPAEPVGRRPQVTSGSLTGTR